MTQALSPASKRTIPKIAAKALRSKDRPSPFFEAARVSSVGLEMALATGIGWGIGYWLDGKFGTGPWLMLVGLLLGVAAGFNGLLRTANEVNANATRDAVDGDRPTSAVADSAGRASVKISPQDNIGISSGR